MGLYLFVDERNRALFELQFGRRLPNSLIVRNPHASGLIQGVSQAPWPWMSAWVVVGGIAPFQCLKPHLQHSIST